ncbi:hypothetical protein [Nitrosomonas sp. Nm58]|uniref:nSTAND3 domain-containing NTPase n=1 Tax=Nitrosomonas sp. Nm58 TaxID=200126 RepID=UPI00089965F8|nr:hypothetical protein [Nitrosomonas sp. Nm58]SDY13767.1 hypothetical protein SAMN05421754_100267 [Nitrosomonas sp. Nm58]
MSIATLAPEKFDFQDLVCIEMMLRFYDRIKFEFRIEPDDGEDAEMMFIRNTDQLTRFEIQVKGAKGTVSLNTVAECLAHFPNRKATDSLFERLMDDPDRLVVLVMSGRCDDESSIYIPSLEWQGDSHSLSNFRKKDAEALLKSLINVINSGGDKSKLQAKRRTHLEKIAKQAILNDVQSILSRLIVIEQVSDDTLMEKCESLLRKHHRIPIDRTAEVIAQLRSIVKTAKIRKQNAFVDFSSELAKFKPPRIRPVGYIAHGKEDEWINTLSRSSALLISGLPRVGKTHVACWIAAEFEEMGYKVEKAFDIDTAERFLLDSVDAQRLAILDDPLGGAHPVADPLRVFLRIKQLVLQLKPDRKLIVAQAQDRLLNVTRKVKLFDLNIAKIPLIEIEAASSEFSCKLWQQLGEQYSISKALFTIVLNALQSGELSLEAGCLHYLAIENQKVQDPSNLAKVEHLAHVDASSLGQALSHEVGKDILIGLAAATSPGLPITESELAFILGHGGNKLLGISRIVGSQISFPKNSGFHHSKEAPNYELLPQLTNDNQDALEKLELRRIVEWCDQERVSFTHPFYQAAAESLFEENTHKTAHLIRTLLERGIFCLSPITSRATARNIEWIHDRLTNEKNKQALVRLAIDALDSSYPSTRDICFGFLIRQLPNLPNNLRDKLPEWVNKVTFISLSHVEWISGEARLPMGENLIVEDNLWGTIEKSEIVGILSKLDGTSATKVTPECACKAINFYENNSGAMTVCAISRLLSYDEALIRAQAINIWLEQIRQDDADVLQRIFMEDHPAVSKAALEGVIKSWNNYDDKRKSDILEGLQKFPASPASASGMINTLLVFGREEYTGAETPWQIFEAVLPDVLNALPETISINDARLFDVIDKASLNLSVESMLRIIDSWVGILERIVTKRILSDFELGVTQILVNVTKNSKEQRLMRMNRLLSLPGTAA